MMEKLDLVKTHHAYFKSGATPEIVRFGSMQYLSIRGKGDPNGPEFQEKIQALYPTIYTLKFAMKEQGKDFVVSKLEGLWWYDESKFGRPSISESPTAIPRSEWEYQLLIMIPDFITEHDVMAAKAKVKGKSNPAKNIDEVELFFLTEGDCVQMLHVGPFDKEPETLQILAQFMSDRGMSKNGAHHEIYLSDFRKTAPERLKTILREPVGL